MDNDNWTNIGADDIDKLFKGKNWKSYIDNMKEILNFCKSTEKNLYLDDNNQLFYNNSKPDSMSSIIGKFINDVDKISQSMIKKFEDLEESVLEFCDSGEYYNKQLNSSFNDYEEVSKDLENYQKGFLAKVKYYIKVAKGCGYILVLIYLGILCLISFFGCLLLLAYSYMTNQGNLDTFMHVVWNSIKFFSFSFLMYTAAFGILYNGLRDLIGYNMFLFGNNLNLNSTETYLLPSNKSKAFLYFCLNEEKADFKGDLDFFISDSLDEFFTNYGEIDNLMKKDYSLEINYNEFNKVHANKLRHLNLDTSITDFSDDDSNTFDTSYISSEENNTNSYTITLPIYEVKEMINQLNYSFSKFKNISNINQFNNTEGGFLNTLDCGFLKNDLNMVYNSLYDLSVQSRILFVLSCCIGFFGEALIHFYLLSMYHYNNDEFKEGDLQIKSSRNNRMNFDISSKNEFLDKSKPINIKKFNQKLDFDYSSK